MKFDKRGNYADTKDPLGMQLDSHVGPTVNSYNVQNRYMGQRFDGGRSPLASPLTLSLDGERLGHLSEALLRGGDEERVRFEGAPYTVGLKQVREQMILDGMSPEKFAKLGRKEQDRIARKLKKRIEQELRKQHPDVWDKMIHGGGPGQLSSLGVRGTKTDVRTERHELHVALRAWAAGPLRMEHPQGSSYHHLVDYDDRSNSEAVRMTQRQIASKYGEPQIVVVENDWARAIEGKDTGGHEVRMPFPVTCWEFRVSGVRVLCFARVEEKLDSTSMFLVYGKDGVWVSDDYNYAVGEGYALGTPHREIRGDHHEFRRVFDLVHGQIRAACILMEVRACRAEPQAAPGALVARRLAQRRAAPRDHLVVRLLAGTGHRAAARGAGAGASGHRTPQGGHLRRGCWVHYDDPDSGEQQYANDGGFVVSKSWRKWHFAGDLKRMITREYRL